MMGMLGLAVRRGLVNFLDRVGVMMETVGVMMTVFFCFSLLRLTTGVIFLKVNSTFPDDISKCLLKEVQVKVSPGIACGAVCSQIPDCTLFCLKADGMCSVLSAKVSQYWAGRESQEGVVSYSACYSSWADYRDKANLIKSTSAYDSLFGSGPKEAVDGYFCKIQRTGCHLGGRGDYEPWWEAEFATVTKITALRIQTRDADMFSNVKIYAGNSSWKNGFRKNEEFAAYPGSVAGEVVNLNGLHPIFGRYLIIKTVKTDKQHGLSFCELQIF